MSSLGGSTNIKTQINNVWGAVGNLTGAVRTIKNSVDDIETNTQNQSAISGATTFSGDVISDAFKVNGQTGFLKADGTIDNSRISVIDTNVAIGTDSLISNTSGIDNMAFGKNALIA